MSFAAQYILKQDLVNVCGSKCVLPEPMQRTSPVSGLRIQAEATLYINIPYFHMVTLKGSIIRSNIISKFSYQAINVK